MKQQERIMDQRKQLENALRELEKLELKRKL